MPKRKNPGAPAGDRRSPLRAAVIVCLGVLWALVPSLAAPRLVAQEPPAAQVGDPPLAALITRSAPDEGGVVTISGAAGAVFPNAALAVRNLYTGETVYPRADYVGAFTAPLYGPGSTPFWISPAQSISAQEQGRPGSLPGGPGTILYGPFADDGSFTLDGRVGGGSGSWHAAGTINGLHFVPGETLSLALRVVMAAPERVSDSGDLQIGASLWLEPVLGPDGHPAGSGNGWSAVLTPGGLPIEGAGQRLPLGEAGAQNLAIDGETLTFTLAWDAPLEGIAPGLYVPVMEGYAGVTGVRHTWAQPGVLGRGEGGAGRPESRLPLAVQVGDLPERRLLWTLFHDQPSGGSRGVLPAEDVGRVALSDRVAFNATPYVLPRLDPTGAPIPYPLEPYLPTLMANDTFTAAPPRLPLRFPSGELSVTVTRPDGTVDDLGTASFAQNRLSTPAQDEAALFGATSPLDVLRLTTLEPRFTAYTFEQDGPHIIRMIGTVEDVWGNVYSGGGTYEVWIGERLALTPGVLPGTPFEVGDAFLPALTVAPAFPAEVSIRLVVYPLDGGDPVIHELIRQMATPYGHFQPGPEAVPWRFETPGEYVVEYVARHTDALGRFWAGNLRGAGVIASPHSALIARGARGLSNVEMADRLAWYALDHIAPDVWRQNSEAHLRWPYHSGDVLWSRDGLGTIDPLVRFTDSSGAYESWLLESLPGWRDTDGLALPDLANEDELPPLMVEGNRAYAYYSAVRPDASARQFVSSESGPDQIRHDWSFDEPYHFQPGVGENGDLPGDFTFLFGGLIVHNDALNLHEAAIYGALAVVIDPRDPRGDRVYPPFGSASGGPDGGPLLTVRGEPLEMFFHPTGFRPGQVFTVGESLALAGQAAPTLPAWIEAEIIAPSGAAQTVAGRANRIGYFYDPAQPVWLDEPGVWRVRLRVRYDGLTSAGRVEPPYPGGGVPGATNGEFVVYVVPPDAPVMPLIAPAQADARVPPALSQTLTGAAPDGWSELRVHFTTIMPGVILESGELPVFGGAFNYRYDPRLLNQTFPNLDVARSGTQVPVAVDVITISFLLSGLDADGAPAFAARTVTLLGERLVTLY